MSKADEITKRASRETLDLSIAEQITLRAEVFQFYSFPTQKASSSMATLLLVSISRCDHRNDNKTIILIIILFLGEFFNF